MLKSKLRAKICLLLCVVFAFVAVTCFSACKGDDFEIVQSITYVTGGETKTETSRASFLANSGWHVATSEYVYNQTDEENRLDFVPSPYRNLSRSEKTIDNYSGLTEEDIGKEFGCLTYRYSGREAIPVYHTFTFYGWGYDYIRVKIVDNTTIVIRDYVTSTPTDSIYTVTSYQITYFDED